MSMAFSTAYQLYRADVLALFLFYYLFNRVLTVMGWCCIHIYIFTQLIVLIRLASMVHDPCISN